MVLGAVTAAVALMILGIVVTVAALLQLVEVVVVHQAQYQNHCV